MHINEMDDLTTLTDLTLNDWIRMCVDDISHPHDVASFAITETWDRATYENKSLIPYGTIRQDLSDDENLTRVVTALKPLLAFTKQWVLARQSMFQKLTLEMARSVHLQSPHWPWNYYRLTVLDESGHCSPSRQAFQLLIRDFYAFNVRESNSLDTLSSHVVGEFICRNRSM